MARVVMELEGAWEDVRAHDAELAGRTVKLQVLEGDTDPGAGSSARSTARTLLGNVQGWEGDDFEECLEAVYRTRQPAEP